MRIAPKASLLALRGLVLVLAAGAWAGCDAIPTDESTRSSGAALFATPTNPLDPALLTPNPVESSTEGTVWACRATGEGAVCVGHWHVSVPISPNGLDCGGRPMYAPSEQSRDQVRYYNSSYLEFRRNRHQYGSEIWSLSPEGSGPTVTLTWQFTEHTTFAVPGDLDSGFSTETGSNFKITASGGRVLLNNAGQASGLLSGDPDTFKGRWDGGDLEPVCAVLTGQ